MDLTPSTPRRSRMTPGDDVGRVTNLKTPVGGVERIVSPPKEDNPQKPQEQKKHYCH